MCGACRYLQAACVRTLGRLGAGGTRNGQNGVAGIRAAQLFPRLMEPHRLQVDACKPMLERLSEAFGQHGGVSKPWNNFSCAGLMQHGIASWQHASETGA